VALVVRPHAIQPMRAGFFFREADGSMRTESSYKEFLLQPYLPPVMQAVPQPAAEPVVELAASPASVPPAACGPVATPARKRNLKWLWWAALALGMAAVLLVFKNDWTRVFAAEKSPSVSLMAYDIDGQLQIHWDWAAEAIRSAEGGTLEIADGATRTVVALEKQRLRSGTVSYARIGARVDLRLALREPGGKVREEFTSFLGQAGAPKQEQDLAVRLQELERAVAGLRWSIRRDGPR
jgi:hypothetical protein